MNNKSSFKETTLKDRTLFITGSRRGIGRAIALLCAREGANIVLAAKSDQPHPKLPGTIHSVAEEVVNAGGQALLDEDLLRERGATKFDHDISFN